MPSANLPFTTLLVATTSLALGVGAFWKTQSVTKDFFDPLLVACTSKDYASIDDFVEQTGYHRYDPHVGLVILNPMVCMVTQFVYVLVQSYPAGLLMWGATILASLPATVAMTLEAGRPGISYWSPLRYPTLVGLLCQLLGISVVFPALWVPAYCCTGSSHSTGSCSVGRSKAAMLFLIPIILISLFVFFLLEDTSGYLWTLLAGILAGPVLPLQNLWLWWDRPPTPAAHPSPLVARRPAEMAATAYGFAGLLALLGWCYEISIVGTFYGTDYQLLWKDIWSDTSPAVQFMTIDAVVLWAGVILHIGSRSLRGMGEAVLLTPVFGPGAACALSLASLELARAPTVTSEGLPKKSS